MIDVSSLSGRDLELFAAFLAGFDSSSEGFNGEYVGPRYRGKDGVQAPAFVELMLRDFRKWLQRGEREAFEEFRREVGLPPMNP